MFKINIQREILERKREAHRRWVKTFFIRGTYVGVLALLTGTFTLQLLLLRQNISAKEGELSKIGEMLVNYGPGDENISADKVIVLSQLKGGRPSWGEKLKTLCSLLPPQMWLTDISLRKDMMDGVQKQRLQVSGATCFREGHEGLSDILEFLNTLRADEDFSADFESIELLSSKRSRSLEREELNFTFICPVR